MELWASLLPSLWAGLSATAIGTLLTTPSRYLVPIFLCGFSGRFVRDLCMAGGLTQNWATLIAAAVVVVVGVATIRGHKVSPVVLISAVIPLGASRAMFSLIFALMQVSSLQGEALGAASVALSANLGKVFVTTLTIALGIAAGMAIVMPFIREDAVEA